MIEPSYQCPLLLVFDMPRALGFYRDLLGFEVVDRSGPGDDCSWVHLRLGGGNLMLNGMYEPGERPDAPDPERVRAHRDTALYIGADVEQVREALVARGVEPGEPVVRDDGMKQLSIEDPDGYRICFQCPAG